MFLYLEACFFQDAPEIGMVLPAGPELLLGKWLKFPVQDFLKKSPISMARLFSHSFYIYIYFVFKSNK